MDLPPEVQAVFERYQRAIEQYLLELTQVRHFRVTKTGRILPKEAAHELLRITLRLRREVIDLGRYQRKIAGRTFLPSEIYWLERAKDRLQMQTMQAEGVPGGDDRSPSDPRNETDRDQGQSLRLDSSAVPSDSVGITDLQRERQSDRLIAGPPQAESSDSRADESNASSD